MVWDVFLGLWVYLEGLWAFLGDPFARGPTKSKSAHGNWGILGGLGAVLAPRWPAELKKTLKSDFWAAPLGAK